VRRTHSGRCKRTRQPGFLPLRHAGGAVDIRLIAAHAATCDKLVCAKSVVHAVRAAHDSGSLDHNYDLHWPLNLAVDLLEQASTQFSKLRGDSAVA
jgi:hypothetical protein